MATVTSGADGAGPAAVTGGEAMPAARRIEALDFVRGVALCGILLMNITGFGLPDAYANPVNAGGATGANLWAWIVTEIGFEGTQRALFSMLFGASAILLDLAARGGGPRRRRRHLFPAQPLADRLRLRQRLRLPVVRRHPLRLWRSSPCSSSPSARWRRNGCSRSASARCCSARSWNALRHIESCSTSTRPMRRRSRRATRGADARAGRSRPRSAPGKRRAPSSSRRPRRSPTRSQARTQRLLAAPSCAPRRINSFFQTWVLYRYFFDMFGMMLIGMALFRLGVLTLERPARLYWAMLALGYGDRAHGQRRRDALDHRPRVQRGLVRARRISATISAGWR